MRLNNLFGLLIVFLSFSIVVILAVAFIMRRKMHKEFPSFPRSSYLSRSFKDPRSFS